MTLENVGKVPIQAPINLAGVSASDIEQAADRLVSQGKTTQTKDQIVNALVFLQNSGISLEQKHIDRINAGAPILPRDELHLISSSTMQAVSANPFLKPNAYVTFTIVFAELSYLMSQIKLHESEEVVQGMQMMMETARDIAKLIIEKGEAEKMQHIASAVTSIVSGVVSLALIASMLVPRMIGKENKALPFELAQMIGQAVNQISGGIDSSVKAHYAPRVAGLDAEKVITENQLRLIEEFMKSAQESRREAAEVMNEAIRTFTQILAAYFRAFSGNLGSKG